jgi:hypothetical protein
MHVQNGMHDTLEYADSPGGTIQEKKKKKEKMIRKKAQ